MFYPTIFWKILFKFKLWYKFCVTFCIKQNYSCWCGALVNSNKKFFHNFSLCRGVFFFFPEDVRVNWLPFWSWSSTCFRDAGGAAPPEAIFVLSWEELLLLAPTPFASIYRYETVNRKSFLTIFDNNLQYHLRGSRGKHPKSVANAHYMSKMTVWNRWNN